MTGDGTRTPASCVTSGRGNQLNYAPLNNRRTPSRSWQSPLVPVEPSDRVVTAPALAKAFCGRSCTGQNLLRVAVVLDPSWRWPEGATLEQPGRRSSARRCVLLLGPRDLTACLSKQS